MKYLIVGLGNIGPDYHETRHNIGFMVVDALAKEAGVTFNDGRYGFTTTLSVKGRQLLLLKPSTFMNLSGNAVRYWMQKENIPLENVLVIVDDLALPFGTLRLKGKGSDAGHNGLKHIAAILGTQNYARLRFGIGNEFPRGGQIDYVLGHFTDEDWKTMDERLKTAGDIIKSFCLRLCKVKCLSVEFSCCVSTTVFTFFQCKIFHCMWILYALPAEFNAMFSP